MQERAKISRRQILQGAADRFEVTGYGSTSMNDIVSAAQMTKGAVYFHFSSKDELAQAVIEEQHQMSITAFTAVAATGAPALEQLVMVCHEMGRQLVADPIVRAGVR
ncbi:TetR family transcriptional regulator, partial [Rhodococcus erythropolis]|nr:TetR family transcriptional regulator [Rhodococcus erythropolis]